MNNTPFILSIDQGTTGSRVFCYDRSGKVISSSYREFTQHYPKPGWVEHDPEEIFEGILELFDEALRMGNLDGKNAVAIGITNQRETAVIWDRETGKSIHPAIVWQCRRTKDRCETLKSSGLEKMIREKTGLVIDAYFSGPKFEWILDHENGVRERAEKGELAAGTMDSYLLYRLTGNHATDFTNASRTMLFNIHSMLWDEDLLSLFRIPKTMLGECLPSRHSFGKTLAQGSIPEGIPVLAMAGDQQAALFGQNCVRTGQAKNTYGTGAFLLFHTEDRALISRAGLITTVACDQNGMPAYALEGSVFTAGAVVQWLRDYMRFFAEAEESEELIMEIENHEDEVAFVPAFTGLGAPHWDMNARGAILGLTRDTTPAQIVRAAVKSIALQTYDLVRAMETDTGKKLEMLRVDGGASANGYLMQYQSDILGIPVERPGNVDTTAMGAAYLAGLEAGIWSDLSELEKLNPPEHTYYPKITEAARTREIERWNRAVGRAKGWLD